MSIDSPLAPKSDFPSEVGDASAERSTRRDFLIQSGSAVAGSAIASRVRAEPKQRPVHAFLDSMIPQREWIASFLDPKEQVWAKFDPELGYLLRNSFMRDGVDGSHTLARYEPEGQRLQINFRDRPCRINTFGNSFTQGHQVGDGETWQEVLAAHFCEPVRNYGIGGFGVYQAYRRLLRVESTDRGAEFLVFNIWGDDHLRSVNALRWLTFSPQAANSMGPLMFHSNPWAHGRIDPATGDLVDMPNPCPTPESVYQLCDRDWMYRTFENDPIVHALAALRRPDAVEKEPLERLADSISFKPLDLSTPETTRSTVERLYHAYAVQVGIKVFEKLLAFVRERKKKLFVLLSYPQGAVWHACNKSPPDAPGNVDWHPKVFKEFLAERKIPFVDTVERHVAEFKTFRLSPKDYIDRYYMGHYNPRGNHFFAYAVKNDLVEWLDPKPPAYRGDPENRNQLKGYLPG